MGRRMSQFLNSLQQIRRSESVGTIRGLCRHLQWQFRREFHGFPCELRIGKSTLYVERPNGVAAMVNCMGEYDYNNMNFVRVLLSREKSTFFDIGANIGSYTLIASEIPNATVVSFEPHPGTFALLRQNVERNKRSNVLCLNVALSDHAGEVQFSDGPESAINRIVQETNAKLAFLRLPARRFDSVCEELHLTPDFVKIDVEGHEEAVLSGFGKFTTLAKVILIEGGGRPCVQRRLLEANYSGPWFVHFRRRTLAYCPQDRAEDPVYIHKDYLQGLHGFDLKSNGSN
jgi:FkbM family methyltransferase